MLSKFWKTHLGKIGNIRRCFCCKAMGFTKKIKVHIYYFQNVSIAVVGKDTPFKIYENATVDPFLELIAGEERRGGGAQAEEQAAPADEGSMDTD